MLESFLNYVVWDPNQAVFSGFDRLRWYSLLFALGFIISQQFMVYFFRKEGQRNYRGCGDQILRNFLKGLTARVRDY